MSCHYGGMVPFFSDHTMPYLRNIFMKQYFYEVTINDYYNESYNERTTKRQFHQIRQPIANFSMSEAETEKNEGLSLSFRRQDIPKPERRAFSCNYCKSRY